MMLKQYKTFCNYERKNEPNSDIILCMKLALSLIRSIVTINKANSAVLGSLISLYI